MCDDMDVDVEVDVEVGVMFGLCLTSSDGYCGLVVRVWMLTCGLM